MPGEVTVEKVPECREASVQISGTSEDRAFPGNRAAKTKVP